MFDIEGYHSSCSAQARQDHVYDAMAAWWATLLTLRVRMVFAKGGATRRRESILP